ncbi:MAG TPA: hypothetical protein VLK82_14745, partial [Candidatus Tectomicrobia bacterium]|nr:hypothetical protein [Candidatus Tectomicrobia bacterium]
KPPFYQQPEADREDIHRDQLIQKSTRYGDRAGQQVRRIGSGFASEGERPTLSGPRCASVHGFSLHANTPRQQGIEVQARPASSRFGWARLLKDEARLAST